ncbi:MAG: methyl-accepting chemotaxis protein [Turicibacter sp.]|nr:methyl-accepting chemotaxis protein [Turicibacter sp.]
MKSKRRITFEIWFFQICVLLMFFSFTLVGLIAYAIGRSALLIYYIETELVRYVLPLVIMALGFAVVLTFVLLFGLRRRLKFTMRRARAEMQKFPFGNMDFRTRKNDTHSVFDLLYESLAEAVESNKEIFKDINDMVTSHNAGIYDVHIDESKYEGQNRVFVQNINKMVFMYVDDYIEVINTFKSYSEGDFTPEVREYQENWAWANDVMRTLKENFKHILVDVGNLAENAAQGKFDISVDSHNFKGEWATMITQLNNLIKHIDGPLADIEYNIMLMANGDFTLLEGDYHGEFKMMQESCNAVNKFIYAYVQEISEALIQLGEGNLNISLKQEYIGSFAPIKTAMNTIVEELNSTVADIQSAVDYVAEGAEEVAKVSITLADGAASQSDSVNDLNNFVVLMTSIANRAGEKVALADKNATLTKDSVTNGSRSVEDMSTTMNRLRESSENIARIIDVITNIAFQTNLLALNASVESARAGEHGRGFSVVAEEVRNLATRSQQSALETSTIVEEDLRNVADGLRITSEVVSVFKDIELTINEISQTMDEVTEIAKEQMKSVSDVTESIGTIARVTGDLSETSFSSSAAADELSSQARLLREKIAFFKIK